MNQHLYAELEAQLVRDSGLSGPDYKVLVPLSEAPGGVLRALGSSAIEIGLDRSRLSHHISRMEGAAWSPARSAREMLGV